MACQIPPLDRLSTACYNTLSVFSHLGAYPHSSLWGPRTGIMALCPKSSQMTEDFIKAATFCVSRF